MHVLKKDGLEKAVKKVVSEKETLSCMFRNEHRCAVYFYSNQKISHPLSSFADVQRMLSFFDVPGSHSHVLLSKHKNDEWQDLGPWIKKNIVNADIWEKTSDPVVQSNPFLKVFRK